MAAERGLRPSASRDLAAPVVSLIVCTHGERTGPLADLLAELHLQTLPFELIVVLGPASADLRRLVGALPASVRRVEVDALNISRARNAGIRVAGGAIVAFIDDDATPILPDWLERLTAPLRAPDRGAVAAVGSLVYHRDTNRVEFAGGATSLGGFQSFTYDNLSTPPADGTHWVRRVPGGNCAFSRQALDAVGGFDEQFGYYLDEADLCVRLAARGYEIVHTHEAPIRHFAAPSGQDSARRRSRYLIARSDAYFTARHLPGSRLRRALTTLRLHGAKHFVRDEANASFSARGLALRVRGWLGAARGVRAAWGPPSLSTHAEPPTVRGEATPFALEHVVLVDGSAGRLSAAALTAACRAFLAGHPAARLTVLTRRELAIEAPRTTVFLRGGAAPPGFFTVGLPHVGEAAREASHLAAALLAHEALAGCDRVIWMGDQLTGALLAQAVPTRVEPLASDSSTVNEQGAPNVGPSAADALPAGPAPSALAARLFVERLGVAAAIWHGLPRLEDADTLAAALSTLRHAIRDGELRDALLLGEAVLDVLAPGDVRAVEWGYHVAGVLRALGRGSEAVARYERVRSAAADPGIAGLRAGACYHLASLLAPEREAPRIASLLRECLALSPDHGAARRQLDRIEAAVTAPR